MELVGKASVGAAGVFFIVRRVALAWQWAATRISNTPRSNSHCFADRFRPELPSCLSPESRPMTKATWGVTPNQAASPAAAASSLRLPSPAQVSAVFGVKDARNPKGTPILHVGKRLSYSALWDGKLPAWNFLIDSQWSHCESVIRKQFLITSF